MTLNTRLCTVSVIVLLFAWIGIAAGQGRAPASRRSAAAKLVVERLHVHDKLSVIPKNGQEEYGVLLASDGESFTIDDVDSKATVTFRYVDVNKVKPGYGGYNFVVGRHTDRTKSTVTLLVVVAGLISLVVAVAAADQ